MLGALERAWLVLSYQLVLGCVAHIRQQCMEKGSVYKPLIFDDGQLSKQTPDKVKAFYNVEGDDEATYEQHIARRARQRFRELG